jgi:MFS family permease
MTADAAFRVIWGIVMTAMGFVDSWSGLMAARWFLGLAEAGLFPGINYYLSCWYKRSELGFRTVGIRSFTPSARREFHY